MSYVSIVRTSMRFLFLICFELIPSFPVLSASLNYDEDLFQCILRSHDNKRFGASLIYARQLYQSLNDNITRMSDQSEIHETRAQQNLEYANFNHSVQSINAKLQYYSELSASIQFFQKKIEHTKQINNRLIIIEHQRSESTGWPTLFMPKDPTSAMMTSFVTHFMQLRQQIPEMHYPLYIFDIGILNNTRLTSAVLSCQSFETQLYAIQEGCKTADSNLTMAINRIQQDRQTMYLQHQRRINDLERLYQRQQASIVNPIMLSELKYILFLMDEYQRSFSFYNETASTEITIPTHYTKEYIIQMNELYRNLSTETRIFLKNLGFRLIPVS